MEGARIAFCPKHDSAEYLLSACRSVRDLLRELKCSDAGQAKRVEEVVLPYLNRVIERAERKLQ